MRVVIIGGKLQGVEAAYLAMKAGYESVVIDKREEVPAKGIASQFLCMDVLKKENALISELKKADFILPALENDEVLNVLVELAKQYHLPLAFDLRAYGISSSKIKSDQLIHENQIPAPVYYPFGKAPYIVKPSSGSGSEGVQLFHKEEELKSFLKEHSKGEEWVIQEFLEGPSYSIEVIGRPGNYKTFEITKIHMDEVYDCKMVTAPCDIPLELEKKFRAIGQKLAEILQLYGIMDVEVIETEGVLKVLEIDARIPSQTPTAVYHSSGVNLLVEIAAQFKEGIVMPPPLKQKKFVAYEHLCVESGKITEHGEHVMGDCNSLSLLYDFCLADEVLTNYRHGDLLWKGTFINVADSPEELEEKRLNMRKELVLL